jgi:hypothetical protein
MTECSQLVKPPARLQFTTTSWPDNRLNICNITHMGKVSKLRFWYKTVWVKAAPCRAYINAKYSRENPLRIISG